MEKLNTTNVIELTKDIISIPSYRDGQRNESLIIDFLKKYLSKNIPWMSLKEQEVEGNRKNIFFKDKYPTRLLVIDHIDTVMPSNNWAIDPCKPYIKDGKLFGLGSSDTKGNISSFLAALTDLKGTKGLAVLLYVDEEYDFKGMKKFVESALAKSITPEYVCSIDGSGISLGLGCRGLIELKLKLIGETAHSASGKGVSVNSSFLKVMEELEIWLEQFRDEYFGKSSLNIARINSGVLENKDNELIFSSEGNKVPDYLEAILEIRTTSEKLNIQRFTSFLKSSFKRNGIVSMEVTPKHDLTGYRTLEQDIENIKDMITDKINGYLDPGTFGYLDISLLRTIYPEAAMFSLGIGTDGQAHRANEYIEINNLLKGYQIYTDIINLILN